MGSQSRELKDNPYTIKPIPDLVGLDAEKEKLLRFIEGKNICFLQGPAGTGKTSLLYWLKGSLRGHSVFFLDAKELNEYFDLEHHIDTHKPLWRRLFRLPAKNVVLLLDEAQLTPQHLTRMMEAFWNNNSIKSIVISQTKPKLDKFSKSLKHRVGKRVIKLAPLSPIKAHEMINLRTNDAHPFTDEALALLAEEAEYIPRKILEYCEISSIELGNKDKIDARDVRYVLDKHEENEADDELPDLDELELKEDALIPLESIDKIQGISPMEGRILKLLLEGGKTTHQLATILNTTIGSVGKQLSKLSKAEILEVANHRRPKVYGLARRFKDELGKGLS